MKKNNKGFTYIEVLFTIGIVCFFIGVYLHMEQYTYTQRQQLDEVDRINYVAQGVMDGYRTSGRDAALALGQGYTINITEDTGTGHTNLTKVTVTVTPNISGMSNITLVTYHSS